MTVQRSTTVTDDFRGDRGHGERSYPFAASIRTDRAPSRSVSVDATAIDTPAAASPEPMPALAVTRVIAGQPYPSSVTSYAADGSVSRVDLYGLAQAFDRVRLDYRADGTLATRTLLDSERPAAAIVIDYDAAGARLARHEIALPDRPYARVDIVYDADGWAETRTRRGFADGDLVSVTVRFDAPGTIARVEHLHIDGTRLIVGTAGAGVHQLAGRGESDTFVLVDADPGIGACGRPPCGGRSRRPVRAA